MPTTSASSRITTTLIALAAVSIGAVGLHAAPANAQATAATTDLRFDAALSRAADLPRLHSLLVSHAGELVLEEYFNGADPTRPANIKSVSKSVISALIGIAIEQGHLNGVEQPIADFFTDQLGADTGKAEITIEDLLTMQAGLETTSNRNYGAWVLSSNWVEFALNQPLELMPGTVMEYSTGNTHLLSAILTSVTDLTTLEFARQTLASPLGFRLPEWPRDPQGIYFGGNDMEMTPRQMLAFGELYLNDGRADGRQIVPQEWVQASLRPRTESRREAGRYYGYGWWIRRMAGLQTPYAWGFGGQFIVLVPELDLVVVTTSDSSPTREARSQRRRIFNLVEQQVIAPASSVIRRAGSARGNAG
jgi:CubicO group peptidase (beta-lactamase class C family)